MKRKLLGAATAMVLLAAGSASFGQGSDSSGRRMSITPGSPTAPSVAVGSSSSTSPETAVGGLNRCGNLVGAERERCPQQERAAKNPPAPAGKAR